MIELKLDDAAKIFRYLHRMSESRNLSDDERLMARKMAVVIWNAAKLHRLEQPARFERSQGDKRMTLNTPTKPRPVRVNRTSKDGALRVRAALARGLRVMAMAGSWFEVRTFREKRMPDGRVLWYATAKNPGSHGSGRPEYFVTSFSWYEPTELNETETN